MEGVPPSAGAMATARRSRANRLRGPGVVIGLLLSATLVWQSTQAAFTATTSNDGNS